MREMFHMTFSFGHAFVAAATYINSPYLAVCERAVTVCAVPVLYRLQLNVGVAGGRCRLYTN